MFYFARAKRQIASAAMTQTGVQLEGHTIDRRAGCRGESAVMPNTRKILIVDDDAELRDALTEQLSLHEEFEAVAVDSGSKGVQTAKAGQIDLVIMDVGLPDIDGREAVRILRKNGFKAPIIMLTGHDTDSDTILGLEVRRQRLHHQAVSLRGAAGAHSRAASPA